MTMKLLVVAPGDPTSPKTWSGAPKYAASALREHGYRIAFHSENLASRLLRRGLGNRFAERSRASLFSAFKRAKADYIIGFASSKALSTVCRDLPCIHVSDATPAVMRGYYSDAQDSHAWNDPVVDVEERAVIGGSSASLLASEWALRSAINDYGGHPQKVRLAPFGACIPSSILTEITFSIPTKQKFLWCGLDWKRKGGWLAVNAIAELKRRGFRSAKLVVIGCAPEEAIASEHVEFLGSVDKSSPRQLDRLVDAYIDSTALLLPSRAEAFGMVFCEAAAFFRPAIALNTGGVGTPVIDNVTGLLVAPNADASALADRCQALLTDREQFIRLSEGARARFEDVLNWNAWAKTLNTTLKET